MMHTNLADHHSVPMATRCVYESLKRCCPTGKSRCQVSYNTLALTLSILGHESFSKPLTHN